MPIERSLDHPTFELGGNAVRDDGSRLAPEWVR
jgi:hypothetical protein